MYDYERYLKLINTRKEASQKAEKEALEKIIKILEKNLKKVLTN